MLKKLLLLSTLAMSGCVLNKIPTDNLTSLSNNELCSALGENSDNGNTTLRILDEITFRKGAIDMDKCHALEMSARRKGSDFVDSNAWARDASRMAEQARRDAEMFKKLQEMGKI
ncbi:hypothetical protein [Xenorhabdus hominickii]|uniref:Lipoprotein n=1 Tax=Xenorhabdus hominickii TaxID=351679 RepID=A0A2G0Q5X0_XENHO|nr:hypothetical protein [Xenorhabdus hominickii]AOM39606.1 hypothetical protein A9255_02755 [Xenorhabdus hominickii]PHM54617.1 hypothetical protein Xhom_02563 [Xenorhabdus hominickii]